MNIEERPAVSQTVFILTTQAADTVVFLTDGQTDGHLQLESFQSRVFLFFLKKKEGVKSKQKHQLGSKFTLVPLIL